ncbi:hypothetical protein EXIGLDRAFT_762930 [Exidia glandulosa HHB12029]|uniref:DASH complex subunit DAM1 n=1 Tax=Exidia glandulosa HHB12029 TaxID=1314781 RepID=A0A165MER8_EXIGL|nr:hypothetical protein EXIGLDRAFT_762930 [Exidia glandulosa HHB12029]
MTAEPRTPLRRVSQGSLAGLARSTNHADTDAPTGLGVLELAMGALADEAEALQANIDSLNELDASLAAFNEGFASFLYVLKMNACCIEWIQAPTDNSFALARKRAMEVTQRAQEAAARAAAATPNKTANSTIVPDSINETTFNTTPGKEQSADKPLKPALKKRPAQKPKMTAKEKRERDAAIEAAVNGMPLEFRGGDINLRRVVDKLISALMDTDQPHPLAFFVKPPELTQAKVNKVLIALVNSKLVLKTVGPNKVGVFSWKGPST